MDGRRLRRATREFTESAKGLPADADLRLLTWQSLHEQLARRSSARCRWRDLLSQYLQDRGLHGFDGFADQRRNRPFDPRWLVQWCCLAGSPSELHLRRALGASQALLKVLRSWRPDYAAGAPLAMQSNWIKRCTVPPHSFLLAASWTVAGSRSPEIRLRRTMDLFSVEHTSNLRRFVEKFTTSEKGK